MVKGKSKLKAGMAFDPQLLYSWRCNLFTQANFEYADRIANMGLCFLEVETFANNADYDEWKSKLSEKDQAIVEEFAESKWLELDPATEQIVVKATDGGSDKVYTSKGMNTEETKLFSFVFNTFVFMQVFN